MNKRTILWVVLLTSTLLLWERWQVFNGKPSMFSPVPVQVAKAQCGGWFCVSPVAAGAVAANGVDATTAAAPVKGEVITIITDLSRPISIPLVANYAALSC